MSELPTFTFDTVACLVAAMTESGMVLGNRHYDHMAKLDGKRTASSFEHQFRKIKARAKELGGGNGDAKATATASPTTKAATPRKKSAGAQKAVEGSDTPAKDKKRGKWCYRFVDSR